MVYIPSERIYNEMVNKSASLWFVPNIGDSDSIILLKCRANVLKAIIKGCSIEIAFGMVKKDKKQILCLAAIIYDDPNSPFSISSAQRHLEEHVALIKILKKKSTEIFFLTN